MEQLKTKGIARILVAVILLTMVAWLLPTNMTEVNAATKPKAPRISSKGTVTWDCVYFGHYPQSSDGKGGFKNEPIKWRVLSVKGNDAFLLADKNLDLQPYNKKDRAITWEKSTIRSWLNGYGSKFNRDGINYSTNNFINKAFTKNEQKAIYKKTVVNEKNPNYGTSGGKNTKDKVFLLSIAEAKTPAYGFPDGIEYTEARVSKNTVYTTSQDSEIITYGWRLRSSGSDLDVTAYVYDDGWLDSHGGAVDYSFSTIRPALYLNLSSNVWKPANRDVTNIKPKQVTILSASIQKPKTLNIEWSSNKNATGYQIIAATDKQFKKNIKTAKERSYIGKGYPSTTLNGLKSGKTYYIKVRGYTKIGKHTFYGPYSKVKSVKVK